MRGGCAGNGWKYRVLGVCAPRGLGLGGTGLLSPPPGMQTGRGGATEPKAKEKGGWSGESHRQRDPGPADMDSEEVRG